MGHTDLLDLPLDLLMSEARRVRDAATGTRVTYSPKVFIPLTMLCRDRCGYCTFAQPPARLESPYLSPDQVLAIARAGAQAGCHEALFTLGERPEERYPAAADWLAEHGYASTVEYLAAMCRLVLDETGLLPHANAGALFDDELAVLRPVAPSQGMMVETLRADLAAHHGAPDKLPERRLATLDAAGRLGIPFTTGILVGIGEDRADRLAALEAIAEAHRRHGHVQEVIVQNFLPKPGTAMHRAEPCPLDDHLEAIALARLVLPPEVHVQAPPNLADDFGVLLDAGIDDWGGVSPVTADHVNPERPWPALDRLREVTEARGFALAPRLTIYPEFVAEPDALARPRPRVPGGRPRRRRGPRPRRPRLGVPRAHAVERQGRHRRRDRAHRHPFDRLVLGRRRRARHARAGAHARPGPERPGTAGAVRGRVRRGARRRAWPARRSATTRSSPCSPPAGPRWSPSPRWPTSCAARRWATPSRSSATATSTTRTCARSSASSAASRRARCRSTCAARPTCSRSTTSPQRSREAWELGATEVCLQGGIHPDFDGDYYIDVARAVKEAVPDIHVHGFTALEVTEGAKRLGEPLDQYLRRLMDAGLRSLPGTAAEILDDDVRAILCPDKITTDEWLECHRVAHQVGLRSNVTIMFGAVESPQSWATHLLRTRDLQAETGGFTEFVGLPFVHMATPLYLQRKARRGPTFREVLLMHAVARIAYRGLIDNIQFSWVKLGRTAGMQLLQAGCNDLGGTLMDENISRAAGAAHGQEMTADDFRTMVEPLGRTLRQRTTLYGPVDAATARA